MAKRFMRAYRKARAWLLVTPTDNVGGRGLVLSGDRSRRADNHHRHVSEARLLDASRRDHAAGIEATLDVFQHAGLITKRLRYEDVVVSV
jgi:hypothetical protein